MAAVGLIAFGLAVLVSQFIDPVLQCHDEFSYLLSGETLLEGRFSNPTPDGWQGLQSLHVLMYPSYASKYPIGTGLIVAVGLLIFGNPLSGSWLSAATFSIACTWMLNGALSKRWSLAGGLLIACHPTLQVTWSQSLLQGYLVATGCALLTGGVLRLRRWVTLSASLFSGSGVALLALTRPFEGLVCTVLCTSALWWLWSGKPLSERFAMGLRSARVAMLPVGLALLLIALQNQAVTGKWWKMPYQMYESQYGVAPLFVFNSPRMENAVPRADLSETVLKFHADSSLHWYQGRAGWNGWRLGCSELLRQMLALGFPFVGLMLLPALRWSKYRVPQALVAVIAVQIAASGCVCWVFSHYAAPLVPWLLLLSLIAVRAALRHNQRRKLLALSIGGCLIAIEIASLSVGSYQVARSTDSEWARQRQRIVQRLTDEEGKHLVLVRYSPEHNVHHEWVYNGANPQSSKIIWARDEREDWTQTMLEHYGRDRNIWLLDADRQVLVSR